MCACGEGAGASQQAHMLNHTYVSTYKSTPKNTSNFIPNSNPTISNNLKNDSNLKNNEESKDLNVNAADSGGSSTRVPNNNNENDKNNNNCHDEKESSDSIYLKNSIKLLKKLGVTILFCSQSFCSNKLLDACLSASIAVFPLTPKELYTVAILTQSEIVGDILDLELDSVGDFLSVKLLPFLSVRARESVQEGRSKSMTGSKDGQKQKQSANPVSQEVGCDEVLVEFFKEKETQYDGGM